MSESDAPSIDISRLEISTDLFFLIWLLSFFVLYLHNIHYQKKFFSVDQLKEKIINLIQI